jgi:hypothetical protein
MDDRLPSLALHSSAPPRTTSLEERLERGEVVFYSTCPFLLPQGEDREFLLAQRGGWGQKNINFKPATGMARGFRKQSADQVARLRQLLADFSAHATTWLSTTLPGYAKSWRLDQVTFRPEEEHGRRLPQAARNDLLHIDAFPGRPSNGDRILRLFANVNLTEPRVWLTSLPFPQLLERYGTDAGLPCRKPLDRSFFWEPIMACLQPARRRRSEYDRFMLRFHDYLKANREFQATGPKREWSFPPGSAWLAFTDSASHAVLRGRYALEHSYFVAPEALTLPHESPAARLQRACGVPVLKS